MEVRGYGKDFRLATHLTLDELVRIDPNLLGRVAEFIGLPAEIDASLAEIPGQISRRQSRLLYLIFSRIWPGHGDVLEFGTLFGASTRAIGLGMALNPHLGSARLYAVDWFEGYFSASELEQQLRALLADHPRWAEIRAAFDRRSFLEAFRHLHDESKPYGRFLEIRKCLAPTSPTDSATEFDQLVGEIAEFSAVFVDSVKAWFPVRRAASRIVPRLHTGGYLIWQDYQWFNSYAIPVFHHLFREHFTRVAIAGDLHAFRYTGGLTSNVIESQMPESPAAWNADRFATLFSELSAEAYVSGDSYGVIATALQLAFAFSDLGEQKKSCKLVDACQSLPGSRFQQELFRLARRELECGPSVIAHSS
jgi:hypothetical protein